MFMQLRGGPLCKLSLLLVLIFGFLIRVMPLTTTPILQNEGILLTIAKELAAGKLLYRDLFWEQMPALPVVLSWLYHIEPDHFVLFSRIISIFVYLISACLIFYLTNQIAQKSNLIHNRYSSVAGVIGVACLTLSPFHIMWSRHLNPELFSLAAILGGLSYFVAAERKRHWLLWLMMGILIGGAVLIHYGALLPVLALFFTWAVWIVWFRERYFFRVFPAFRTGVLLIISPVLINIGVNHATGDFLQLVPTIGLRLDPATELDRNLANGALWFVTLPICLAVISYLFQYGKRPSPIRFFLICWTMLELCFLFLHKNIDFTFTDFSVLLLPIISIFSILAGCGAALLISQSTVKGQKARWVPLTLLILIGVLLSGRFKIGEVIDVASGNHQSALYFEEELEVSAILHQLSDSNDPILVLGNPALHVSSDRSTTNRFFHLPDNLGNSLVSYTADADLVATISHERPQLILISNDYIERISPVVMQQIEKGWMPMVQFEYEYQSGATLYLPKLFESDTRFASTMSTPFENGVDLLSHHATIVTPNLMLFESVWQTNHPLEDDYQIEVKILNQNHEAVGATHIHSSIENHPTSTWQEGENVYNIQLIPIKNNGRPHEIHVALQGAKEGTSVRLAHSPSHFISIPITPDQLAKQ